MCSEANKASEWNGRTNTSERKREKKGVGDKSRDYGKKEQKVRSRKQQNNKFNCFLVRLLSPYPLPSCFLFLSLHTTVLVDMEMMFFILLRCYNSFCTHIENKNKNARGVKSHVKFPKHHFSVCTLNANY